MYIPTWTPFNPPNVSKYAGPLDCLGMSGLMDQICTMLHLIRAPETVPVGLLPHPRRSNLLPFPSQVFLELLHYSSSSVV